MHHIKISDIFSDGASRLSSLFTYNQHRFWVLTKCNEHARLQDARDCSFMLLGTGAGAGFAYVLILIYALLSVWTMKTTKNRLEFVCLQAFLNDL